MGFLRLVGCLGLVLGLCLGVVVGAGSNAAVAQTITSGDPIQHRRLGRAGPEPGGHRIDSVHELLVGHTGANCSLT